MTLNRIKCDTARSRCVCDRSKLKINKKDGMDIFTYEETSFAKSEREQNFCSLFFCFKTQIPDPNLTPSDNRNISEAYVFYKDSTL